MQAVQDAGADVLAHHRHSDFVVAVADDKNVVSYVQIPADC